VPSTSKSYRPAKYLGVERVQLSDIRVDPIAERGRVEIGDLVRQLVGDQRRRLAHANRIGEQVGVVLTVERKRLDRVGGGDHLHAVALRRIDRVHQARFEPEAVDDEGVRLPHGVRLLGRGGEVMGVDARRHDHLDLGLVADEVSHHITQDVRGHHDVHLAGGAVVVRAARRDRGHQEQGKNGSHSR